MCEPARALELGLAIEGVLVVEHRAARVEAKQHIVSLDLVVGVEVGEQPDLIVGVAGHRPDADRPGPGDRGPARDSDDQGLDLPAVSAVIFGQQQAVGLDDRRDRAGRPGALERLATNLRLVGVARIFAAGHDHQPALTLWARRAAEQLLGTDQLAERRRDPQLALVIDDRKAITPAGQARALRHHAPAVGGRGHGRAAQHRQSSDADERAHARSLPRQLARVSLTELFS
ncbi:MAG TPA: hypothetical protein VK034_27270 [Enhygromyxa sp.]|nr:hypothetical protein [Enhygromyxa sp.]